MSKSRLYLVLWLVTLVFAVAFYFGVFGTKAEPTGIQKPVPYEMKALAKRIDKYLREHDSAAVCKIGIYPGVHDWNITKEQVWALKDIYAEHWRVYHDWFNLVFEKKSCL